MEVTNGGWAFIGAKGRKKILTSEDYKEKNRQRQAKADAAKKEITTKFESYTQEYEFIDINKDLQLFIILQVANSRIEKNTAGLRVKVKLLKDEMKKRKKEMTLQQKKAARALVNKYLQEIKRIAFPIMKKAINDIEKTEKFQDLTPSIDNVLQEMFEDYVGLPTIQNLLDSETGMIEETYPPSEALESRPEDFYAFRSDDEKELMLDWLNKIIYKSIY